jgi:hypothetical protein
MKEVAPYHNEALLAQGQQPEPTIPEAILEKWQKIVNLMAEMVEAPAGVITRIRGEDLQIFVSSSTEGNPLHSGDSQRFCGSGLYCEAVVTKNDELLVPNALFHFVSRSPNKSHAKLQKSFGEVVPILRASEIPYRINSLIQTHKILINRC